jgi:hypothetical protein
MPTKTKTRPKAHARRRAIGENPLDAYLAPVQAATKASRRGLEPAGTTPRPAPKFRTPKVRATFHLPEVLFEACRNAVVALSGPPVRLTLARLAEDALRRELERLKKEHHRGQPFPPREGELKGGRPIGT